jgi:hypothetical protein
MRTLVKRVRGELREKIKVSLSTPKRKPKQEEELPLP